MNKLPPIPKHFFSTLGPLAVEHLDLKKANKKGLCGLFDWCARKIHLRPGMERAPEWVTLWHESTHAVLFDGGVHQTLTKKQVEAICDAMGHHLTAMMQAGWLKFTVPQEVRDL